MAGINRGVIVTNTAIRWRGGPTARVDLAVGIVGAVTMVGITTLLWLRGDGLPTVLAVGAFFVVVLAMLALSVGATRVLDARGLRYPTSRGRSGRNLATSRPRTSGTTRW